MVSEASWVEWELEEEMEGEGCPERLVMVYAQEMMEEMMEGTAQEWQDVVETPVEAAAGPDLLLAPHA